jgi:hypothetical protein
LRLAVGALLVSGVFVLLVAVARTPLVELIAGRGYLHTALVAHVVFALDVWMLAFASVLWVLGAARAGARLGRLAPLGLAMAAAGAVLLTAVPLAGLGQPIMSDYLPILVHPVFLLGLVAFFLGIACVAVAFLSAVRWRDASLPLAVQCLGAAAVAYLGALAAAGLAAWRWGTFDHATLVWGGGHLLQVVNATALIALWLVMGPPISSRAARIVRVSLPCAGLAVLLVLLVPIALVPWETVSPYFWAAAGLPLFVTWLVIMFALLRGGKPQVDALQRGFLYFSLVLLPVGGVIALPGMGSDTRVTAHYHAVVGAVTMMFMGQTYHLLGRMRIPIAVRWMARAEPYLYGYGLLSLVGGLYLAGEAGTTRKTFEAIARGEWTLAGALFVIGAVATIAGGIAFVTSTGVSLLSEASFARRLEAPSPRVVRTAEVPVRTRG